ncbi:MAG: Glu/Leu/Phe/Val dehydrogenase dimerization domain-containing protein [Hyphomonadaceae bacterium]
MSALDALAAAGGARCLMLADEASGLRAFIAIDSLALGPAAGGIRTMPYGEEKKAIGDAVRLAAAMTLKCAVAGLDAGGGKTVVIDHPGMKRGAAFEQLGRFIQELRGLYYAAGDVGTTEDDLAAAARFTAYVHRGGPVLAEAAGQGVLRCMEACAQERGRDGVAGLRVAIQGCGAMGAGVARALHAAGARLVLADTDGARVTSLARELSAEIAPVEAILHADVDIVAPCALGGVITLESVRMLRAWAICGAANNQLANDDVGNRLAEREVFYVPDFLASAGAVISGMSASPADAAQRIDGLRETARTVLQHAAAARRLTAEVARAIAYARINAAGGQS